MSKPYRQMTADERVADRIAKNRESDRRAQEANNAGSAPAEVRDRRKAAANAPGSGTLKPIHTFAAISSPTLIDSSTPPVPEKRI
jgi:hypothetical protein